MSYPGAATFAPSASGLGGPSCSNASMVAMQDNPGMVSRVARGCFTQPSNGDTRPLAVDSVVGGDGMAAAVFGCRWT